MPRIRRPFKRNKGSKAKKAKKAALDVTGEGSAAIGTEEVLSTTQLEDSLSCMDSTLKIEHTKKIESGQGEHNISKLKVTECLDQEEHTLQTPSFELQSILEEVRYGSSSTTVECENSTEPMDIVFVKMELQGEADEDLGGVTAESSERSLSPVEVPEVEVELAESELMSIEEGDYGRRIYCCEVCPYRTGHAYHMKMHLRTHTGERPHKCSLCPYASVKPSDLRRHVRTHTGELPFKCEVCGFGTSKSSLLIKHMKTHIGKPCICTANEDPGATAESADSSSSPIEMSELVSIEPDCGRQVYCCEVCPYKTGHRNHMRMHLRTHTGERPHKCELCPYAFAKPCDLRRHMRTHAGNESQAGKADEDSGDGAPERAERSPSPTEAWSESNGTEIEPDCGRQIYRCDVCQYKTTQANHMKIHLGTHSGQRPHKCTLCPYACSRASDLRRHVRKHSGERPHKCEVCGYRATESSHLRDHMATHTGDKPFACTECPYRRHSSAAVVGLVLTAQNIAISTYDSAQEDSK